MSSENEIPYFALLAAFAAAKKMNTGQLLKHVVSDAEKPKATQGFVDTLADGFGLGVRQLQSQYAHRSRAGVAVNGKASRPGAPPFVRPTRTATSRKIAKAAFGSDGTGGIDVREDAELSTSYLGFELSPLRTPGGAHFVRAEGTEFPSTVLPRAGNAVRIDMLGLSSEGTPVVQEVKVAGDSDPPIALLQALAYTATLCPRAQYERLRRHYAGLPDVEVPKFDIQIVVAGAIPSARSTRRPLWHVMPDLIERVSGHPDIARHIGRISGIRLDEDWPQRKGRIRATPIDWSAPD